MSLALGVAEIGLAFRVGAAQAETAAHPCKKLTGSRSSQQGHSKDSPSSKSSQK
eukprot:CAMPEP_0172165164 /NCGR_PEP_ID=MMETSP1050-20130122/8260_1 /TAXON_ID=233186 /ORGANISM="Cryptomonas curvata, Strain CCAP979/52" /LENGTH=53 /DNA_ID=CAMNT_0012835605 /DNA_START=329 /DNA_END=487 /DNA_ORIENTATION=+